MEPFMRGIRVTSERLLEQSPSESPTRNLDGDVLLDGFSTLKTTDWGGFLSSCDYELWSWVFSKLSVLLPVKWKGIMEIPWE